MKRHLAEILRRLGIRSNETPAASDSHERVLLYLPARGERVFVGELKREGDEFVFAYAPGFVRRLDLPPLPDFPQKDKTYRSARLWPFFLTRLPPAGRPDVRDVLSQRGIPASDTLQVLGELGRKAISSPYELELRHAS
jgi:hypothetical protein